MLNVRAFALICLFVALFAIPTVPALAQDCGLPTAGATVQVSTTYTLTADCTLTGTLAFGTTTANADKITITINGGGHTIIGSSNECGATPSGLNTIIVNSNAEFNLNNVTIKDGGRQGGAAVHIRNTTYSATISNVTFISTTCSALRFDNTTGPAVTHTLSNLLFEEVTGEYTQTDFGIPTAIHTIGPVSLNINNIALRAITQGNAAIGANDDYRLDVEELATKGRITFSGCLTVDGVFPRIYNGDIVDISTGPCSGAVGNGGSAIMQYPQAPISDCGLPLGGLIYGEHVYDLKSDCALTDRLYIPYESNVVIKGNRFTIDASAAGGTAIAVAGDFSLKNVVFSGATASPIVSFLDKDMSISDAIFRGNAGPLHFQDSVFSVVNTLIENHAFAGELPNPGDQDGQVDAEQFGIDDPVFRGGVGPPSSAIRVEKSAQVSIRDSVFRGNTGGVGALHAGVIFAHGNPSTTLEGCITFDSNDPADIFDPFSLLIDNRDADCPPDMKFLVPTRRAADPAPSEDRSPAQPAPRPPAEVCDGKPDAVPVGSVACIFRHDSALAVWRLDEQSRGFFMVAATQAQIDAVCAGLVASSTDGRAAIFVSENRDVIVSVGPDYEGKVLHVTLDGGMYGRASAIVTTHGPPPGLAASAQPQVCTRALNDCMVSTHNILNFRDAPDGNIQYYIPYDVTLTAFERTPNWFYVDYHGDRGWISAEHVSPLGNCD